MAHNLPWRAAALRGLPVRRRILGVEILEERTTMTADVGVTADFRLEPGVLNDLVFDGEIEILDWRSAEELQAAPELVPADDLHTLPDGLTVDLVLQVTDSAGVPIQSAKVGSELVLHVYAKDVREQPFGVFAAYLDVSWSESLARITGDIEFSGPYQVQRHGTTGPGFIDEAGAAGSQMQLFGGLHEVFRVSLLATGAGDLIFAADAPDLFPQHDILVHNKNIAMPLDVVRFGAAELTIYDSTADTAQAETAPNFAALMFLTAPVPDLIDVEGDSPQLLPSILPTPGHELPEGSVPPLSAGAPGIGIDEESADSLDNDASIDIAESGNSDPHWPDGPGDAF